METGSVERRIERAVDVEPRDQPGVARRKARNRLLAHHDELAVALQGRPVETGGKRDHAAVAETRVERAVGEVAGDFAGCGTGRTRHADDVETPVGRQLDRPGGGAELDPTAAAERGIEGSVGVHPYDRSRRSEI